MSKTQKTILLRFLIINIFALVIGISYGKIAEYFTVNFPDTDICLFKEAMHFYCPGCGGSRAVIAVVNFDFLSSLKFYPPVIMTVILIILMDIFDIKAFIKNEKSVFNFKVFYLVLIAVIAQFLLRNILLLFGIDILGDILPI